MTTVTFESDTVRPPRPSGAGQKSRGDNTVRPMTDSRPFTGFKHPWEVSTAVDVLVAYIVGWPSSLKIQNQCTDCGWVTKKSSRQAKQ